MRATKRSSKRIQNPSNTKKEQNKGSKSIPKVEQIDRESEPLQKNNSKRSQVICIDDQQHIERINPEKKLKQDVGQVDQKDEAICCQQALPIQVPIVGDADSLKVVRLNHFFKQDGQILFQVMVGYSPTKLCRYPQLMTFSELVAKEQTKVLVYQFIASACKAIALEDELQLKSKQTEQ